MDISKISHAIEFFSDPSFLQIVSYGTRDLKLDSGEILTIPEVIRTMMHSNLVRLYTSYCTENSFSPLSSSTLFQILKACAASKRTCLKGVDNIAADGSTAVDTLMSLVDRLEEPEEWKIDVKNRLSNTKIYLKRDYKLHIQREDECAYHCQQYALSDPKTAAFRHVCTHTHLKACDRCDLFTTAIDKILEAVNSCQHADKNVLLQDVQCSERQIFEWKSHILRTVNQDEARHDVFQNLKENRLLIVMDWAMKFLPHLFREKMSDWFGQKSIHWHCAVSIFRDEDGTLKHKTFTHTMDVVKHDFFAVLSVLEHLLQTIKTQLPKITEVYLRSDNAGCYHCGHLWLLLPDLSQRTGIKILGYDFSEAQSGKSYCDAKIAHMRGKIRSHAAEGHNISTAYEVKKAIECGKGI